MQFFGPNVVIDGTTVSGPARRPNSEAERSRYEKAVADLGDKIRKVAFGQQVLDLICNNAQFIVIAPSANKENADAMALRSVDAFAPGQTVPGPNGTTLQGTGHGSPTVVHFDPHGTFGGISPDATLLHELIHAYRKAVGRWAQLPMAPFVTHGPTTDFENWEEFLSVVAESMYRAEAGAGSVRMTHQLWFWFNVAGKPSGPPVTAWGVTPQTDSQRFAAKFGPAILRILQQEPEIYRVMRTSTTWFNPVRDYEDALFSTRN